MSSSDDEDFSSNGSRRAPLGSPALPRFVSRGFSGSGNGAASDGDSAAGSGANVVTAVNLWNRVSPIRTASREQGGENKTSGGESCLSTPTSTTSSRRAWGPDGAAGGPTASERGSRRKNAKIRRAMVLAVQKKEEDKEGDGSTLPAARRTAAAAGHGVHSSTGSYGGGGGPGIFAAARPTSFGVSSETGLGSHHSAGEEHYGVSVGGGGAHGRSATQGDGAAAVRRRVRLSSIGSVGSAGEFKYSADRSALGGPSGNVGGHG